MNYLGHIVCSHDSGVLMSDNLVVDMLTHREMLSLRAKNSLGLKLHLWLDQETDSHLAINEIDLIFRDTHKKYSPVLVDLIVDFLIAHNWYRFRKIKYEDFCKDTFTALRNESYRYSTRIQNRLNAMINSEWLLNQRNWEGLRYTLKAMDKRTRFPSNFAQAEQQLKDHFAEINALFWTFWKDMYPRSRAYVLTLKVEGDRNHS